MTDLAGEQVNAERGAEADDAADGDEGQQPGRVHHRLAVISAVRCSPVAVGDLSRNMTCCQWPGRLGGRVFSEDLL